MPSDRGMSTRCGISLVIDNRGLRRLRLDLVGRQTFSFSCPPSESARLREIGTGDRPSVLGFGKPGGLDVIIAREV